MEPADSLTRQGRCHPHTAGNIPLLAGLAAHEECVRPHRGDRAPSYALRLAAAPAGGEDTEVTAVLRERVGGGAV
ncbi:hypothetical protein SF12_22100, partial [Streptomyces sp. MBRL 601]